MFNIFRKIYKTQETEDLISLVGMDIEREKDWAKIFARCFSTPDGKQVLTYIKFLALEKTLGPNATSEALFYQEGRRSFFTTLMTLVKQGRDNL